MKKFFMALALAAVAMVATSCVQGDDDFAVKGPQKSVQFSLANVISTRGVDAMIPDDATKVVLNDCQVFFVDATGNFHPGKDINDADAVQYFTTAPTAVQTFHFLPAAVEKVVVVGNYGSKITATNLDAVKALTATWTAQQNDENLLVYGEAELVAATENDKHANTYVATVNVKPLVARIEIGGFVCDFSDTPAYEEVHVTMVALNNYYADTTIGGTLSHHNNTTIDTDTAYPFFNATAPVGSKDDVSGVVLTKNEPSVDFADDKYLVYHTFAGQVPQLVVRVKGVKGSVESPLYLATKGFTKDGVSVTEFKAGEIYRMKFRGKNHFAFDEEDLSQPEKCVEVSIEVAEWVVVNVTPEF